MELDFGFFMQMTSQVVKPPDGYIQMVQQDGKTVNVPIMQVRPFYHSNFQPFCADQ